MLSGSGQGTLEQVRAMAGQTVFSQMSITANGSVHGQQNLTNADARARCRIYKADESVLPSCRARCCRLMKTLTSALLIVLAAGISVAGVPSMVSGLKTRRILDSADLSRCKRSLAAARAEARARRRLTNAQRELKATPLRAGSADRAGFGRVC